MFFSLQIENTFVDQVFGQGNFESNQLVHTMLHTNIQNNPVSGKKKKKVKSNLYIHAFSLQDSGFQAQENN